MEPGPSYYCDLQQVQLCDGCIVGPHCISKLLLYKLFLVPQQVLKDVTGCQKNLVMIPEFTFLVFSLSFGRAAGTAPQQSEFSTTEMMLGCPEVLRIHFGSSTQVAATSSQSQLSDESGWNS